MTRYDATDERRAAARRTAVGLGLVALMVFVLFIYLTARGG